MYIDFNEENNKNSCTFKIGDNVRTPKYKNMFAEGYVINWSKEVVMTKKV